MFLLPLFLATCLSPASVSSQQPVGTITGHIQLPLIDAGSPTSLLEFNVQASKVAKLSPKLVDGKHLSFPFSVNGYGQTNPASPNLLLRLRVFCESSADQQQWGIPVARELTRIWAMNFEWLKFDHNIEVNSGIVDVYLCREGTAGGEQLFGTDNEGGTDHPVDTIYIYNMASFTDPLEEAREVAHEYGHAVMPAVGGYSQPEYWANGYMGEKLFLRWIEIQMRIGALSPDDAMNAPLARLDHWVKLNTRDIETKASSLGPNAPLLRSTTAAGMAAYHGIVLYCDSIFPSRMFGRAFVLTGSQDAKDYPQAAVLASEEKTYSPKFPDYLLGNEVWIPVGNDIVKNAKVLSVSMGWDKVIASEGIVVIARGSTSN